MNSVSGLWFHCRRGLEVAGLAAEESRPGRVIDSRWDVKRLPSFASGMIANVDHLRQTEDVTGAGHFLMARCGPVLADGAGMALGDGGYSCGVAWPGFRLPKKRCGLGDISLQLDAQRQS